MKKLLHESLRDIGQGNYVHSAELDSGSIMLNPFEAAKLLNEIEKYYIPRPRFEDGEPVQFGDEFVDCNGHNQTLSSLTYTKGGHDYVSLNGWTKQRIDGSIKRPEPKVLDAEGVEINPICNVLMKYDKTISKRVVYAGANARNDNRCPYSYADAAPFVVYEYGGWDYARNVICYEPDSYEKLRDDMMTEDKTRGISCVQGWVHRLTALMERDA